MSWIHKEELIYIEAVSKKTIFSLAYKNVSAYIFVARLNDRWEVIMLLAFASALFALFVVNVSLGSFGATPFLGIVGEMLLLVAVSVAFVAVVLKREANEKHNS
ncbi:hypothetical protein [Roseibium algae]|uniref:Uncharacterized protein n=1 Tax=Roseibium algae TaxID=3123038 RepID=A0ABU8TF35_9HYPH